ncbi:hypothetical protein ONR57_19115 [Hoyosella sp. YIM 151337]|uniref:hypothetical protein n=1 Tax=Hoyosella sp. YIM 151337 TaxID=2992742 RepID=UPI002235B805|nr:hypothetical protein [Hoyosella sp. YIM 151337]MCW4355418.1 hypothetical protein [Hoyosella sp. YIM 151337]
MSRTDEYLASRRAAAAQVPSGLCLAETLAYFPNARFSLRAEPEGHRAPFGEAARP